ncbi:hypothetical protein E8E11_005563 [Didymella keratinophila]|nr:hypothetical protein E8E11_005563 [Didymella keratinophila]
MEAAFDAEAAAAVDMDALFAAPPSQQKHMLSDVLQRKIHAVQPEIANEILEELLETSDVNELIDCALDETSLHAFITKFLIEVIEGQRPRPDTGGQGNKRRQLSPEQSTPLQRVVGGHTNILRFNDVDFQLEKRIRDLSSEKLRTQDQYHNDPETQHDPFNGVICVYISNFFTGAINLTYYVRGTRNVAMFCSGMSGMQAFNGAALFVSTRLTLEGLIQPIWGSLDADSSRKPKRLVKSKSPIEANKRRYIFETGRTVWEKSGIDLDKLNEAMEMSDRGGTRKRSQAASDNAANKVASLRGGSGRADNTIDESLTTLTRPEDVDDPDLKRFLRLRQWASRNRSADKSMDDRHERSSNPAVPNQPSSKHDTVENLHGTSSNHATSNPSPSLPDPVDDLDGQCFEQRAKQWSMPSNVVRYGMSDEWQTNI